jgi:hypothetical protein
MILLSNAALGLQVASLLQLGRLPTASAQINPDLGTTEGIELWMNEWMGATKAPMGTLHLSRFKDPIYFLTKPIAWKANPGQETRGDVNVPKDFVTDLTSVPRIFWSLLRPDGDYTYPAIIHDYLYWQQGTSRHESDLIFRFAMEDFDISTVTATTIYKAVQLGGKSAWDKNTLYKARGEKRVLKRFPTDPRITWQEWKTRPEVFATLVHHQSPGFLGHQKA